MIPEIKRSFMFLPTATDIWVTARDSYSDEEDLARLYELKTKAWSLKQGERTETEYWLEMSAIWQELDLMSNEQWKDPSDAVKYKEKVEYEWVFQFLARLKSSLDDVRSRIMCRLHLPSTWEVFT